VVRPIVERITLVSTFPCAPVEGVDEISVLPVAFGNLAGSQAGSGAANPPAANSGPRKIVSHFRGFFMAGRNLLGPLTVSYYGRQLARIVENLRPDLVHAMRLPFEGMMASYVNAGIPLVVTIWGNDLTFHAHSNPLMATLTRRTLQHADGLAADTQRDLRLGLGWGYNSDGPTLYVPGSGGVNLAEIERIRFTRYELLTDYLPAGVPLVVNPRGFRPGSVRNDIFFAAIPLVLRRRPETAFVCPAMAGQPEALKAQQQYKLKGKLHLLPHLQQNHLWDLFVRASVMVSISQHDGTPNTLLEAMSCGCFPVAGDIESTREWITPGANGLLVEPSSVQGAAEAILAALESPTLRKTAAENNLKIIRDGSIWELILMGESIYI
jgi:hypothetical protein